MNIELLYEVGAMSARQTTKAPHHEGATLNEFSH